MSSHGNTASRRPPLQERIDRVTREEVAIVPYDPAWPELFRLEKEHLLACLPRELLGRIEHFGSTAVPGLAAKPVVDMLVEIRSADTARERIVPVLESQGYDYFWRPEFDGPPFYHWFIKRDARGARTHHIHMVEAVSRLWDRLLFRDHLIACPAIAADYAALKRRLAEDHRHDRIAYTKAKSDFITSVTERVKQRPRAPRQGPA
jgi:GrpB-like predicted nucleotidyltransferase (UPF0157 family)